MTGTATWKLCLCRVPLPFLQGQVTTFRRAETGRASRCRYADVLKVCKIGASDTVERNELHLTVSVLTSRGHFYSGMGVM